MSDSGDTEAEGSSTTNLAGRGAGGGGKADSKKKLIRLLTVMAYVSAVSGTAFVLSMYYLFLWEPKVAEHHLKADPHHHHHQSLALHGPGGVSSIPPLPVAHHLVGPPWAPPPPAPRDQYGNNIINNNNNVFAAFRPPPGHHQDADAAYPQEGFQRSAVTPDRPPPPYPLWVHAAPGPQPPRPPSLSLVLGGGAERESILAAGRRMTPPPSLAVLMGATVDATVRPLAALLADAMPGVPVQPGLLASLLLSRDGHQDGVGTASPVSSTLPSTSSAPALLPGTAGASDSASAPLFPPSPLEPRDVDGGRAASKSPSPSWAGAGGTTTTAAPSTTLVATATEH